MPDNPTPTEPTTPATGAEAPTTTPQPTPPTTDGRDAPKDAALGDAGLKALEAEREARKALEKEVGPLRQQMDALRQAFGGDSTEGKPEDVVASLQEQVAAMQRNVLVSDVARRHGITDDEDVAILRDAKDEEHMTRLAQRLKAPAGPVTPAPDPGQGARPSTPQAEADAEYAKYFPSPH